MNKSSKELLGDLQDKYMQTFERKLHELETLLNEKNWTDLRESFNQILDSSRKHGVTEITNLAFAAHSYLKKQTAPETKVIAETISLLKSIFDARKRYTVPVITKDKIFRKLKY